MEYSERRYRGVIEPVGLTCYQVELGESDLYVCTRGDLSEAARESLARHRDELEGYLASHPSFGTTFRHLPVASGAPGIVADMGRAAELFDVGPMACVAGAVAQHVGTDLLNGSGEVIVENGGDIFLAGGGVRKVRIFAGSAEPPVDITVRDRPEGVGLCTSSGTVGPSVSLGGADAVTVLASTASLADAAATAIGNRVRRADDIESALEAASGFGEVLGVVVVAGGSLGAWGAVELG
jgi:ApbE superfamily uncharacterized protein (UPF0280 family)